MALGADRGRVRDRTRAAGRAGSRQPVRAAAGAAIVFLAGSGARLQGGIGDVYTAPRDVHYVMTVRRASGDVVIDLRHLKAEPAVVRASVGAGHLSILLPDRADTTTSLHVGRGTLDTGAPRAGVGLRGAPRTRGLGARRVSLLVIADVGLGTLRSYRIQRWQRAS